MRASLSIFSLLRPLFALLVLAPQTVFAEVDCEAALGHSRESTRILDVSRPFHLYGPVSIPQGRYTFRFSDQGVTDVDGFAQKGKVFPSLKSIMTTYDARLADPQHVFYRLAKFRITPTSPRTKPIKFLFLEDFKRRENWDNLGFVPADETSIYGQTRQTKALFKRLKNLRSRYVLETVPDALKRSTPTAIFAHYKAIYTEALDEIEKLRILNVEHEADRQANHILDLLIRELTFALRDNEVSFARFFGDLNEVLPEVNFYDLGEDEYQVINGMRSRLRSSITEAYVALRVPAFLVLNMSLRRAIEKGVLPSTPEAIAELEEAGVYNREMDVVTTHGIFEVKSGLAPDFLPYDKPSRPNFRIQDQELARDKAVRILKKHGLVPPDFFAAVVYADGKLQEHVRTEGLSYGVIDPSQL